MANSHGIHIGKRSCVYFSSSVKKLVSNNYHPASRSTQTIGGPTFEDDELPQEVRDQIAQMEAQDAAAASNTGQAPAEDVEMGGTAGGIKICPHCTFENTHGAGDCEVCGLPL